MISLRDYQDDIISRLRDAVQRSVRRVCVVLGCGGGKTVIFSFVSAQAKLKGNDVLVLQHRAELIQQTSETLARSGISHGLITAGRPIDLSEKIQVASVQTVARRLAKINKPRIVIIDECFVAGTMIGETPIERVKVGDVVACFSDKTEHLHRSAVTHLFKRPAPDALIEISAGGRQIVCTENHPIFTRRGWARADEIMEGDLIYANMRDLRRCDAIEKGAALLEVLPDGNGRQEPPGGVGDYDGEKPDVQSEVKEQDGCDIAKDRPSAQREGRERQRGNGSADDAGGGARHDKAGVCVQNADAAGHRVPVSLQNRHSGPGQDDCDRGGRQLALSVRTQGAGPQEAGFLGIARVDGITVHKRGGAGRFAEVCPDGFVYNFEVDRYSTYFANGIAVHNCHHATAGTWKKIINEFPDALVIGMTATPARTSGQGLGDVFEELIEGPTVKELIETGYLAPFKYYAPPQIANMDGVRVRMGDYDQHQIAEIMDRSVIIGDAVQHYSKLAPGKRAIVYCVSVDHSKHTAQQFCDAGYNAAHLDGDTHPVERKRITGDFKAGRLQIITNCDLLGEGYDVPGAEVVILLRPTQSLTLYIQQAMRGMRIDPEKPDKVCTIIDHVGNVGRHGLPDEDREWSLEGTKKRPGAPRSEYPIRQCPKCYTAHKPTPLCPACGYAYPVEERAEIKQEGGELAEVVEIRRKERKREVGMARTLPALEAVAMRYGYSPYWVRKMCELKKIPFGGVS